MEHKFCMRSERGHSRVSPSASICTSGGRRHGDDDVSVSENRVVMSLKKLWQLWQTSVTHTHTRAHHQKSYFAVTFGRYAQRKPLSPPPPPSCDSRPHQRVCNRIMIIMDIAQATSFNASDLHNLKVVENGSWHHLHAAAATAAGNIMAGAFVSCGDIKRNRCH